MCILYVDRTEANSPQDRKTAVLNTNPVLFTSATFMTLEENVKGLTFFKFLLEDLGGFRN